jgi:hypothetical protein
LAVTFAVLVGACGDDEKTVYVFGDSLVTQSTKYLEEELEARGFEPHIESLSGSATCDWFENAKKGHEEFDPDVVVMSFSGNALGPCMLRPDGTPLSPDEYTAKYRADTERAVDIFGDTPVFLVGAPVNDEGDDRVFRIYEDIARERENVEFVDGGKYVAPDQRFAKTLPCRPEEPCTGPTIEGERHNVVRAPDNAHFCPDERGVGGPCKEYSSGAYRFALAIAEALERAEQ